MAPIILVTILGLLHLCSRVFLFDKTTELPDRKKLLLQGLATIGIGFLLYTASSGIVALLLSASEGLFSGPPPAEPGVLSNAAQILNISLPALSLSRILFEALAMTAACIITYSAGKKLYITIGTSVYFLLLFLIFIGSAAVA